MAFSQRLIFVLALICVLTGTQIVHAAHYHDGDSPAHTSSIADCSICSVDHVDDAHIAREQSNQQPVAFTLAHQNRYLVLSSLPHGLAEARAPPSL